VVDFNKSQQITTHGNTRQHTATHCNTLQHTATHGNTRQHTATHCNTLQHTATHGSTLQHTVTHCNTLQHTVTHCNTLQHIAAHCNRRQYTTFSSGDAAFNHFSIIISCLIVVQFLIYLEYLPPTLMSPSLCETAQEEVVDFNKLQHSATYGNTPQHTAANCSDGRFQQIATLCSTLQHTASHCSTLQNTATHYYTLQNTATYRIACSKRRKKRW